MSHASRSARSSAAQQDARRARRRRSPRRSASAVASRTPTAAAARRRRRTGGARTRFPVTHDEHEPRLGVGPDAGAAPSRRCSITSSRGRVERKALGAEVLHLYREINLIYSFSEKLAALLDLERVAQLTLQQARQLIVATDGVIMLLDEDTGVLTPHRRLRRRDAGVGRLPCAATGIIGAVARDRHRRDRQRRRRRSAAGVAEHAAVRALIVAPLKVGERVIGRHRASAARLPMPPTRAAELKLLNTLALQTATAIENARLFERTVQAAHERERLLALHKEAELARAKLESELKLAARIQADLFPPALPRVEGYELAARNRPGAPVRRRLLRRAAVCRPPAVTRAAAVRGGRVRQGAAGGAGHEQHAGDAARPARAHRLAAGAGRARERAAVRLDAAGEVRDRGARRPRAARPARSASSARGTSTT